jgi:hypothetical protein
MVKKCLLALNLNSQHYIELINERAHLNLTIGGGDQETANTTKQMKKQILSKVNEKKSSTTTEQVNWKCLKLILELMQACLVKGSIDGEDDDNEEYKMDINNNDNDQVVLNEEMAKVYESFIQLIPYLFLILETIEENFDAKLSTDKEKNTNEAKIG